MIDGVWYIFGGDNGRNFLSDVEAFDPKGNSFNLGNFSPYGNLTLSFFFNLSW